MLRASGTEFLKASNKEGQGLANVRLAHASRIAGKHSLLALSCLTRGDWLPQQVGGLYAKLAGKPIYNIDTGRIEAPLKRTDIGTIDLRTMCQFLL